MKKFMLIAAPAILIVLVSLQFFRPEIGHPPVTGDLQAPADVKAILKRACYDCHSNQTNLRWYDKIQPVYWQVAADVRRGRAGLNFSNWDKLSAADQKGKLWEAVNQIEQGAMPIKSYAFVHSDAKVSKTELTILKNYLAGMVHSTPNDTAKISARDKQLQLMPGQAPHKLPESLNGITYIPDYKNWQVISTSDRFDNGTMRVIYGNEVALKAVKEHHINPWPNGTIFAKAAWDKLEDAKGNVTTDAFKQVEFKDVLTNKAAMHNTTLPFTRNVVGSMDYTPVTFSNSQHPHITSYGHELALSVVFESGLQHFADRPEAYYALPEAPLNFLKTVPVAWDETKLLNGYPGDHVIIARRKGSKWYIGGLNGKDTAATLEFTLDFISQKKAKISIIQDGENDKSFKTETKLLSKGQKVDISCLPRGGFVCVIE